MSVSSNAYAGGGIQRVYSTSSPSHPYPTSFAPFAFFDDFIGGCLGASSDSFGNSGSFHIENSGQGAAPTIVANAPYGCVQIALANGNGAGKSRITWNDKTLTDGTTDAVWEFRVSQSVALTSGSVLCVGLVDANVARASINNGALAVVAPATNATNWLLDVRDATSATANGADTSVAFAAAGSYDVIRFQITNGSGLSVYFNGTKFGTSYSLVNGTSYSLVNGTFACQPYISIDKANGTSVGTVNIDYVSILGMRV